MAVTLTYVMHAAPGQEAALEAALRALAAESRKLEGISGLELTQDIADPARFLLIERWESKEVHDRSGANFPKELVAPVMAACDGPPQTNYTATLLTL